MLYASLVESSHRALATPDIVIIGFYFALVFGIGMYFARRERTSEDYFLAGRNVGWFFIGASLFVSNISTEHRSEEHTSELQSRLHLVCRLLLEKKKKTTALPTLDANS